MGGRLVLQSVLILWLVQCVHTGGYAAGVSGVPNGHEAHFNGRGVGTPIGTQNGGYPHKGYGGVPGMGHGTRTKGNGRGQGGWPQGYGSHAGATNHHPLKGNGYRGQAGAFAGQGNKGYGGPAAGPQNGNKGQMKGYGPTTGALGGVQPNGYAHSGFASKGYGYGAKAGLPNRAGNNGRGGPERKPVKGYGQPYYAAGAGVGASHGQGLPQPARNQANAYGTYGTLPIGGYNGGYGSAGMSLGRRYGSGGLKGPKPGYGYPNGGTRYPVKPGYGNGVKPNGYGLNRGGYVPGVVPIGYGAKPTGYGAGAGGTKGYGAKPHGYGAGGFGPQGHKGVGPASPGQGLGGSGIANQPAKAPNSGFGQMPYGKGPKMPGAPKGQGGLKGDVLTPQQPGPTLREGASPQRPIMEGDALPPPEPTSGRLVLVTQDQYQKLPSPVPQGKNYIQPQVTPGHAPVFPQGKEPKFGPESSPGSAHMRPLDKGLKPYEAGPAGGRPVGYVFGGDLPTQKTPEAHDDAFGVGVDGEGYAAACSKNVIHPEQKPRVDLKEKQVQRLETEEATDRRMVKENGGGPPISKGQGAKAGKPDCGPGGPNGQWMKIPRPGTNTKGYGAGAGVPNRFGTKPGYANNGYGGLGYPSAGKGQQPIYRPEANLGGAGYVKGNAYPGNAGPGEHPQAGYPNGYVAGVQPNYANLGQGVPTNDAKSGGGVQVPYNGAPAGVDGSNQPEPQPVGLGPNGKQGPVYGGMEGLPYGGQAGMGPEKANAKYGIGGLQFGGNPQTGNNGGGYYGYGGIGHLLGLGNNGHMAGKYGYGRMPHDVQPVGFAPQLPSPGAGQYGPAGLPYQSGPLGFGPNMNYGGGDGFVGPQGHGGEGKPAGKHDNLAHHQGQPLQSASDGRSGSPYDLQPATAENTNENVGYISGTKLQPEVISLPAAPTPLPLDSGFTPGRADDLSSDLAGTGGLAFNPDADTQAAGRGPEQPDDPEQMPRQLHIQQQLKLHFHPQGAKNSKYDLNGFFGNSGY